jgi:N-acetylglucosamine kinase-like BadF-type ATPase
MRRIGFKAPCVVVNDALVALVAGVGDDPGVVIIAGTGSIAYGRNADGRAARAGGWGYVLGDEGSGYWMGRLALRSVVREADGRGEPTALTPLVLQHFGVSQPADLIREVYYRHPRPSTIASAAACVQSAADTGDATALRIIELGATELAMSAESVTRRLGLTLGRFVFVLAGGIFRVVPRLASQLRTELSRLAPLATCRLLEEEPALGAVHLALQEARGGARLPAYVTL